MPYLSHNYRFETKSRAKSLAESFVFVIISAVAIFFALFVLGWISASAAQAVTEPFREPVVVEEDKSVVQIENALEDPDELEISID